MSDDEIYMHRCLQLAKLGEYYVAPNPMVGAVLVQDGRIIGEGWHHRFGEPHAEVEAFRSVDRTRYPHCADATLYVSLEPCSHYGKTPPCVNLILQEGVHRVVVGCLDPNPCVSGRGVSILREAGVEVVVGVLETQCRLLNRRFLCLHEKHRPYVVLKWAQTADGYMGYKPEQITERGQRLQISNSVTKQIVHKMRAENMAIMVGTNTALQDNPRLLTTHWSGRNPVRIVLDRHGRLPIDSQLLSDDAPTLVYRENTDWQFILHDLASKQIHSVMVEGGRMLLQTIIDMGIYDEVHVEVAPFCVKEGIKAPVVTLPVLPERNIDGNLLYEWTHTAAC